MERAVLLEACWLLIPTQQARGHEHTVMLLLLSTSISLRHHDRIQTSLSWSFGAAVGLSPGVRLSFKSRSELITVKKIQWGGRRCCRDVGMINTQLSHHFLNIIIITVHQSVLKIGTLKAGHGASCSLGTSVFL